jgi:archaellum component FlaF (FlaF/FlaG flagellin family)
MTTVKSGKGSASVGTQGADWILNNLKFIFFLVLMGVFYIAISHYTEKKVREIQVLQKEVVQLRWEYLSLKSDIMYEYKMSEVAKNVSNKGLVLKQPRKIIVED